MFCVDFGFSSLFTQAALETACSSFAANYAGEKVRAIYGYFDSEVFEIEYKYFLIKDEIEDKYCYVPTLKEVEQQNMLHEKELEELPF